MLNLLVKTKVLMFFVSFFHVIGMISNFNLRTAKHLVQASCTELTLTGRGGLGVKNSEDLPTS